MPRESRHVGLTMLMTATLLAISPILPIARERSQGPGNRTVYVTAVDGKGAPVPDLAAPEFAIKEDGKTRPVTHAALSKVPLDVALMIDDSGVGLQSIREGAAAFVTRLRGLAQIALITTGGRNIKALDFTDSTATQMNAINKTFARNVTGAFLTDGILETATDFAKRESRRPVIVSVGVEGDDFSQARPADILAALQRSRTQLYMIRLGRPTIGQSNELTAERGESMLDEHTRFNAILGQAPARTGGRIEQLASHTGIPNMMEAMAAELASQYEVTFTSGDLAAADVKLEISTTRRGVKVRAPQRLGPAR
ncbi:MAG: VWA domain-containing protein [Vicinamibacterales bacterium]